MGVQPVTYKKDSSTEGFAKAGDTVGITQSNANTIQKDADQGNVDVNNAQQLWLDKWVDEDSLDYSDEEMKKVGENQIDTEGEDGENLSEKNEKGGAAAAVGGATAGAAAAAAAAATIIITAQGVKRGAQLGEKFPAGMLAAGIIATAGGAVALACSFEGVFDSNLAERKNQTSAAEGNNAIIQQYTDQMNADMETMVEETATYQELSEMQTEMTMESITNVGALQAEMQVYQSQGNQAKVAELKAQIEEEQGMVADETEGPKEEMGTIKENLDQYTGNNAEAAGVKASGDIVSEFLKDGSSMEKFAKAAQIASFVGAAAMLIGVAFAAMRVAKDLAGIFTMWAAGPDGAGMGMFIAGGLMMGLAGNNFGKIADSEGAAGSAGDNMAGLLASLGENVESQAGFTEETGGLYLETDQTSTEATEKTQQETDKANQKQAQALGGKNKPEDKEEKPEDTTGGAGAGAGTGGAAA